MCDRCAVLEEQIAYLKHELGQVADLNVSARLHERFGLTPQGAAILQVLHQSGRVINALRLAELMGSHSDCENIVSVQVSRVRKKVGRDAVTTVWGRGYSIGPAGSAAVEAARAA